MTTFDEHIRASREEIGEVADRVASGLRPEVVAASSSARAQAHRRQRVQVGAAGVAVVVLLVGAGALAFTGGTEDAVLDVGNPAAAGTASTVGEDSTSTSADAEPGPVPDDPGTSVPEQGTSMPTSATSTSMTARSTSTKGPTTTKPVTTTTVREYEGPGGNVPPDPTTEPPPPQTTTTRPHAPPPGPHPDPLPGEVVAPPQTAFMRWKANAPARYTMRLMQYDFNTWEGPYDVTVEGNTVVAVVDSNTGEPVDTHTMFTIWSTYDLMLGEFGTSGCNCVSTAVASGLPVDGVFSWFQVTNNAGDQIFFRAEISGFWVD